MNALSTRLKIRVINNHAVYSAHTTVINHALQENPLRAVLYRLPVIITATHTLYGLLIISESHGTFTICSSVMVTCTCYNN